MPILDHFNLLSPVYDALIQAEYPERLIALGTFPIKGRLLDAGGGTGRISEALQSQVSQTVVADLSLGMLTMAAEKKGIRTVCAMTERLPFQDSTFERVIMVDALHHVLDQSRTAYELWRVVAPGGKIIIEEFNYDRVAVKLIALAEKLALMRSHFLRPSQIELLFPFPDAKTETLIDGNSAWVVIGKSG